MDIAKAFEILSRGKIVSANSSQYSELANMLLADSFFNELNEVINKIGYRLISESGYFYISKRGKLNAQEQQAFISSNRDLIVAVSLLRQLYPRLDRGNVISFIDAVLNYGNIKINDSSILDKLKYFSWIKNKDDEKGMLEQLFKHLEDKNIIERVQESNTDKYKVLDAINYYLSIVDSIETGAE
jgi:uncharacterized protein YktA (UPF0223 family)